jgi:drug/metabolite transporter (DMT)-like permease
MAPRAVLVRGIGVILASAVFFGSMAVAVRIAARAMPGTQIAFVRFAGSFLILLALGGGRSLRPKPGNLGAMLLRGLLGAGAITLYYLGIEHAGAGFATLLHCTYPVSTAVFATTLMGERFDRRLAAGLALAVLGVTVVLGPGADLAAATTLGAVCALGASILAGGAVATARQLRLTEGAYLITTYFMGVGMICTAPALLGGLPPLGPLPVVALVAVVVTSVGGQVLLHQGLGFAPATQGSLAAATTVVTAAVLEAVFLGEHLSRHTLIGAALLVAAVALAVSGGGRSDGSGRSG